MKCEINNPFRDLDGALVSGNMHDKNPQFAMLKNWQRERNELQGTGKAWELEANFRKNRPRYIFCDGYMHYKSFGSDPCYEVVNFCPDYIDDQTAKNPDFKRGRL
jgi:hypothetical protein